ncbi:MAG: hypothetical protein ACKVQK_20055 [Burkholderiales bacterium]
MSVAHVEQFYGRAANNMALFHKMVEGTQSPNDFIANAVKEAQTMGYSFTFEEADTWIKKQQQIKASGELTDSQLEVVAGGKNGNFDNTNNAAQITAGQAQLGNVRGTVNGAISTAFWGTVEGLDYGMGAVTNWFNSW